MTNVPLNCNICPKQPTFSDISHLLTHVSSKGHLSHYHKLQVRSHQEPQAGHDLAVYDQWYSIYGLAQLLSERMLQKEAKKAAGTNRPRTSRIPVKREQQRLANNVQTTAAINSQTQALFGRVNDEINPASFASSLPAFWQAGPSQTLKPDEESDLDSSPIVRKTRAAARRASLLPGPKMNFGFEKIGPSGDDLEDCPGEDDPDVPNLTPDNTKLKGIMWPGMDLFDSATDYMKRTRNQKKDGSLLRRMEQSSESIEATEVIYSPGGKELKQRVIDGRIDDSSSPLRGETPVPKKRAARPGRKAMTEKSTNSSQINRRAVKAETQTDRASYQGLQDISRETLPYVLSSSDNGTLSRFTPTEDENLEFQLTVGNMPTKKRNFAVFKDVNSSKPVRSSKPEVSTLSMLNEESAPPSLTDILAPRKTTAAIASTASTMSELERFLVSEQHPAVPRRGYHTGGYNDFGTTTASYLASAQAKENIEPIFNRAGRVDAYAQQTNMMSHLAASPAHSHAYNMGIPFGMGLGNFPTQESYGFNPLTTSFHNPYQHYDNSFAASMSSYAPHSQVSVSKADQSPREDSTDFNTEELSHLFGNGKH